MAIDLRTVDRDSLSTDDERAYTLIAAGEPVPEEYTESVARLAALGFVKIDPEGGNRPVALNPERAAKQGLDALLVEATARVEQMRSLHHLSERLAGTFQRAQSRSTGGSLYIDDAVEVNARLDNILNSARIEILAAQPGGPRTREQLARSVDRDRAALDRGVALHTLYRDSVRQSSVMADHIRVMTGHGAQYRTLVAPYERAIVIDRKHAFVSDYVVPDSPPHAAWHVTDRAAIGFIVGAFMNAWQLAQPWAGEAREPEPQVGQDGPGLPVRGAHPDVDTVSAPAGRLRTTPLERAILRDMVDGIQQSTSAARLGISTRTLQEHMAVLKQKFGAVSPAQLGCQFALSPDYRVDDSAPAGGRPTTVGNAR